MSKLDDLLKQYCPDGVEYKRLGDIATEIFRGAGIRRDQVVQDGIPCVRYGEIYTDYGIYFDSCISHTTLKAVASPKWFTYGDILFAITGESVEEIAKSTAYLGHDRCLAGGDIVVLKHNENPMYLSYALSTTDAQRQKSKGKTKSKVVHSSVPAIESIVVPVPPRPVQDLIAGELDTFTKLTAELTAELTARRAQYEYYRDKLLSFDDEKAIVKRIKDMLDQTCGGAEKVEYKKLGDIAVDIYRGSGIRRDQVVKEGIPCVRYGEIYTDYGVCFETCKSHTTIDAVSSPKWFSYGDILFAITGESVEEIAKSTVYLGHEKCLAGGDIVVLRHSENPKYMAYALSTAEAQRQKSKGKTKSKVVHSSIPSIAEIVIPVPPLNVQEEIASILDKFNTLTTDITAGLPAEISLRQKQYEHYRDRLLNFNGGGMA